MGSSLLSSILRDGFRRSVKGNGRGKLIIEFQVSAANCSKFKHNGY